MKLINRSGNNRIYNTDKGNIEVVLCLDPNLYIKTGYYLRLDSRIPSEILSKRFSSGKQAVFAAYNAML
jgi:hypothetical protein